MGASFNLVVWFMTWLIVWGSHSAAVSAQRSNTAAIRSRLANPAPMSQAEIADVLQAARESVAYRTLRLSFSPTGMPGPQLLMDSDGRPKFVDAISGMPLTETFTHFTRQAARYCDGSRASGELVVEYMNQGRGWSVRARRSPEVLDGVEPLAPVFAALTGDLPLADAGHGTVGDRPARDLKAPWKPPEVRSEERLPGGGLSQFRTFPGGPVPADATEHLWIDEQTLLPLRWSITMTPPAGSTTLDYGVFFVYDRSIELRPPDTVRVPTCIE